MKKYFFYLFFLCLSACINKKDQSAISAKDSSVNENTGTVKNDSLRQKDFHTTYTDVIENLFLFINKQDWNIANSFYADSSNADKNASFFKELFKSKGLKELKWITTSRKEDGIYVNANAKKLGGSTTPMCFLFYMDKNRIIGQKLIACEQ